MKYYYQLQYRRIYRVFKDFGTEPIIGWPIIIFLFCWISLSFFDQVLYANYIYVLIAVMFVYSFNNAKHKEFLQQHFLASRFKVIVVLNNIIKATPFGFILVFKGFLIEASVLYIITLFISFIKKKKKQTIIIPTPFGKYPTEFIIGFRKTFWVFPLIYSLAGIAIYKENYNLGIFALILILLVCSGYYTKPDPQYYIWIHAKSPKEFLKNKIIIALKNSLLLMIPVLVLLIVFYSKEAHITLLFLVVGWLYIVMYVLMKHAFEYYGLGIFQGIVGVLCLLFPPLMIITIPYFYKEAIHNLNRILQ
ncbi:hypothetical protein [Aquimarina litoralis]|uniref:hypothetical protein n=1 Tax=Aquimarina litoralis TaxID=584605 RepID=UPI001C59DE2B|nr:hypothetical protein [Aquimarina litoralis]MBW1296843.1 hypothetical protein [Aquimarina litoralis]